MTTWQCAGCNKIWQAEEPPAECACGCRIVREVTVTPVAAPAAPEPVTTKTVSAEPAACVQDGRQPFWRRAQVQGMAAVCACAALAAAGWGVYAWHSARERRRAETEAYVFSSYQPSLDKAKALKAASPDKGQGFGPHLDALSAACSGAEAAWGAKNQELCRTFLEKAQTEQRWLDGAVPGRAKAAALRLRAEGGRSEAEKEKAAEYAAVEWAAANAAFARADGLREKGEFASALAVYGEAAAGYKKAAECARVAHAAAAKAKFEGLSGQLSAKFDLLEKDACQTGLVSAAAQDVSALERLASEERGYLPEAEARRLADANGRLGRYRARAAFGMRLAEIEAGLAALGQGAGQPALLETVRGRIGGALRDAGGRREDQTEADLKRLADAEGRLKAAEAAARAARVAELLAKAAGAKKNSEWRSVRENAEAALALDAGCPEALAFRKEAQDHLTPTLWVTATVDGQEVEATLSDGTSTYTTPSSLTLEQGKSYEYTVTYRSLSGTRCRADSLKITANWEGTYSHQMALEPALITPATFEQALQESAAGTVLELTTGEYCFSKYGDISRDLTLRGRGIGKTVIRCGSWLTIDNCSVTFEDCSVESTGNHAIKVDGLRGKVSLSNCTCKTLSNDSPLYAVWLKDGCAGSIKNCELNGVSISEGCVCEIADSRVIGANGWGVRCGKGSMVKMTSTTVSNCKDVGVIVFENAKCEMNDCKLVNNSCGCWLNAASACVIANRCEFGNNRGQGVRICGRAKLNNCRITGNGEYGIDTCNDRACEYYDCTFYGNKKDNIDDAKNVVQRYSPVQ